MALTNEDKVYWPAEGYTKRDLVDYYRDVAPLILPYLRDRPESLHRHPEGVAGEGFFQKDVGRRPPPGWVETARIASESGGGTIEYLVCQDEDTLLYLANLGCIELNPWNSRVGSLERPDYLVIDLDPESIPFARVIEAALAVRRVLDRAGAECLCKTSGKTGLHVFVPLGARYSYEQARQFAEIVANIVHRALPQTTSVVRSPAKRQRRVYLDFLQNRRGQTLAAPYCVRPAPGAPVSTPLKWREVRPGLDPAKFTIRTLARRVDKVGDLWAPVLGPGINLSDCLEHLAPVRRATRPRSFGDSSGARASGPGWIAPAVVTHPLESRRSRRRLRHCRRRSRPRSWRARRVTLSSTHGFAALVACDGAGFISPSASRRAMSAIQRSCQESPTSFWAARTAINSPASRIGERARSP